MYNQVKNTIKVSEETGSILSDWHSTFECQRIIANALDAQLSTDNLPVVQSITARRPASMRCYDQIPMQDADICRQAELIIPFLEGKTILFLGDSDCASLVIAAIAAQYNKLPTQIIVLDFDARLVDVVNKFSFEMNLSHILSARRYNVFDPIPADLERRFEWFYTNPPYGAYNRGASARLFISRAMEMAAIHAHACIILPDDDYRHWTQVAMLATQRFLYKHGWIVAEKISQLHRYSLDDDTNLTSSLIIAKNVQSSKYLLPHTKQAIDMSAIPRFYGRTIKPPYPKYISSDGSLAF